MEYKIFLTCVLVYVALWLMTEQLGKIDNLAEWLAVALGVSWFIGVVSGLSVIWG